LASENVAIIIIK